MTSTEVRSTEKLIGARYFGDYALDATLFIASDCGTRIPVSWDPPNDGRTNVNGVRRNVSNCRNKCFVTVNINVCELRSFCEKLLANSAKQMAIKAKWRMRYNK